MGASSEIQPIQMRARVVTMCAENITAKADRCRSRGKAGESVSRSPAAHSLLVGGVTE